MNVKKMYIISKRNEGERDLKAASASQAGLWIWKEPLRYRYYAYDELCATYQSGF